MPPGTVLEAAGNRLVIAAGKDAVMPASVQPAGKRPMAIDEFLRGHRVRPGESVREERGEGKEVRGEESRRSRRMASLYSAFRTLLHSVLSFTLSLLPSPFSLSSRLQ